jgi:alpha-glucosidase (family GH31 glycosyl hydrolase)
VVAPIPDGSFINRVGSTLSLGTALGQLEVTVCTPRIVRVRLAPDGRPAPPSYLAPRAWPPVDFAVQPASGPQARSAIETGSLVVEVETNPVCLAFADSSGHVMLRAPVEDEGRRETVGFGPAPSLPAAMEGVPQGEATACRRVYARFEPLGEQHFYGLGEGGRQFDRLGSARQLWNSHVGHGPGADIGVPLLLSSRGYGLCFDNTSDAWMAIGRSDGGNRLLYCADHGHLDWYYLAGGDLRGLLNEVAELLGRAPLPPRWALGYLQSTRHFTHTAELLRLPRTLREKRIPCDGLIFLSTYGDAQGWNRGVGHLEFHPELWPRPAAMLAEIRAQHFHVITHEYPVLHEDSPLFADANAQCFLLADGYARATPAGRPTTSFQEGQRYVDFSHPAARCWWWAQHRQLADLGVAGWWLDGGEGPAATVALHGGDGLALHNLYDRLRQQAFADGEAEDYPDRRVFLLCRSGAAGMQRDGAACWSGDINNTFATLEAQVPLGLNTGLSGIPYWGTDIGGFFHPVPESGELYARWFQFGAFCPIFRAHGWVWREHVPWAHGPAIEAICRRYAELRYRLLPYTYTLAWQAHSLGLPLMRPLVMNYPHAPQTWELGSQYLWGDDLLVAPVTRAGASSWPVYLPEGSWYDFWTQTRYAGPGGVSVEAPLDRLPLLVRAGAILPLGPPVQFADERQLDEVTLLMYPGGRSRFVLYEDDGHTNAYRQGHYALTPLDCAAGRESITVHIGEPTGDRSQIPSGRVYIAQVLTNPPRRVTLAGVGALPRRGHGDEAGPCWWHDGRHFTYVRLPVPHASVTIER